MKEITDMKELLNEIEAYLCFRLMADTPVIDEGEIRGIRNSIIHCLKANNQPVPVKLVKQGEIR